MDVWSIPILIDKQGNLYLFIYLFIVNIIITIIISLGTQV